MTDMTTALSVALLAAFAQRKKPQARRGLRTKGILKSTSLSPSFPHLSHHLHPFGEFSALWRLKGSA